jgi:peroxiredoxin
MELLRDRRADFDKAGVQPIGISRDSPWTHIAWTQALDLNFGLLSDFNGDAIREFGIAQDYNAFRDVARRSAFLIDDTATVRVVRVYENSEVPDVEELLADCRALQSG